jgi:hypothetical protein
MVRVNSGVRSILLCLVGGKRQRMRIDGNHLDKVRSKPYFFMVQS